MALGYDGSIRIDTSIDPKGFNKGTKELSSGFSNVMGSLKKMFAVVGFLFTAEKIISFVRTAIQSFDLMGSSFGGKIKEMQAGFEMFKGAFVNALLAIFTAFLPYILTAMDFVTQFLIKVAQIVTYLTGAKVAQDALTKAINGTKAAAKGALASFDQLNVLSKASGTDVVLPTMPTIPQELMDSIDAFKAKLMDFLGPAIDGFNRLVVALTPLGQTIWAGLKWAWDNVLVPFGSWVITDALPAFFDLLGAGGKVLNEALIALKPSALWLWENFLKPAAEWTGGVIIDGLKWLTARLNDLSEWIKKNPEQFANIIKFLIDLAAAWVIVKVAIEAYTAITAIMAAVTEAGGVVALVSMAASLGMVLLLIGLIIVAIAALIYFWPEITKAMESWGIFFTGLFQYVSAKIKSALEDWKVFFTGMFAYISAKTQSTIEDWKTFFSGMFQYVSGRIQSAIEDWKVFFVGLGNFLHNMFTGIVNSVIDLINGMTNAVAQGINSIIDGINSLSQIDIPGFSIGVSLPNVSAAQIPHLATGAVIPPNAQFAAILGDQRNGTNIEAPADLIRQIVREEMQNNSAGDLVANITLTLDGEKLYNNQQKIKTRRGNSLSIGAGA